MAMRAAALKLVERLPWVQPPPPPAAAPLPPAYGAIAVAVLATWVLPTLLFLVLTRQARAKESRQGTAPSSEESSSEPPQSPKAPAHPGVLRGSISVFLLVSSAAITFPFIQTRRDALGCDALCVGGQTSLRSALGLVGAALIGRASDTLGRVPMLWVGVLATLAGLLINYTMDSIEGMWLAIVPAALFNQNFSVAKALFSDYIDGAGGTDAERAGAVGKLGMAVGFAFMFGPTLATFLVASYTHALLLSAVGTVGAAAFLLVLPTPAPPPAADVPAVGSTPSTDRAATLAVPAATEAPKAEAPSAAASGTMAFMQMPVLKTRGAQLLMAVRLLMAFAFHMFAPIWQVSIKKRFDFGPKDHAQLMGVIGLTYALSQGLVAKPAIRRAGRDPTMLLLLCIVMLGGARPFALTTSSVGVVFALYVPMVVALGVMNTAITTACSGLAAGDQLGGLFGVLESVESIAGMLGPALGGLLSRTWEEAGALAAVVTCYAFAFGLVGAFFGKHVIGIAPKASKTE